MVQVLSEDHFVLAEVLLRRVSLQLLHSHLILEEFFCRGFKPLLLDRSWYVAFLQDAPRNEHIVVDFVFIGSHFVRREEESVKVIFVFPALLAGWQ